MNIITCKLVFRYFMKILNSNFVMTKYLTGKNYWRQLYN